MKDAMANANETSMDFFFFSPQTTSVHHHHDHRNENRLLYCMHSPFIYDDDDGDGGPYTKSEKVYSYILISDSSTHYSVQFGAKCYI
ncbi:hypothetical protein DERF_009566 [Dermatophagoides farinae]|uniref:Uncharacterized protein n=1 Tax=Dermatophagoides farinae TaxID=6954 RepID=A0A922HVD2_DERFA|nr:hypothetical protein DERF_009566 [Dermatophagoides farinae]